MKIEYSIDSLEKLPEAVWGVGRTEFITYRAHIVRAKISGWWLWKREERFVATVYWNGLWNGPVWWDDSFRDAVGGGLKNLLTDKLGEFLLMDEAAKIRHRNERNWRRIEGEKPVPMPVARLVERKP